MPDEAKTAYQSFLVRCWFLGPATADAPAVWRFEVREVSAEPEKHRFSDIKQLTTFIAENLANLASGGEQDTQPEGG